MKRTLCLNAAAAFAAAALAMPALSDDHETLMRNLALSEGNPNGDYAYPSAIEPTERTPAQRAFLAQLRMMEGFVPDAVVDDTEPRTETAMR